MSAQLQQEDFTWLNGRLETWARYARGLPVTLGLPKRNSLDRIIKEGMNGAAHVRGLPHDPDWPAAVRETDQAVLSLPPSLRTLIRLKWISRGNLTSKDLARQLHTSENTIKLNLTKARHWLAGRLSIDA